MKRNHPKAVNQNIYDGRTVIDIKPHPVKIEVDGKIEYTAIEPRDKGDDFSTRPYDAFWYEVPATGDILCRKLYTYEIHETTVYDPKTNTNKKRKSPQELTRLEICRAAGQVFDDIDTALDWLEDKKGKHSLKAYIEKLPSYDDDGEQRRDKNGCPCYWYKMILASPERVIKEAPPAAVEIPDNRAAEAEAKRANKNRRGYAGNTGID